MLLVNFIFYPYKGNEHGISTYLEVDLVPRVGDAIYIQDNEKITLSMDMDDSPQSKVSTSGEWKVIKCTHYISHLGKNAEEKPEVHYKIILERF